MNTNSNNDTNAHHTFDMSSMGKVLETPVDERSGEWASSTLSALGPSTTTTANSTTSPATYPSKMTTHPTMSATHTLGSTSSPETVTPAYSHKFPNPNPTDTITAADAANEFKPSSSPIFPDAAQTAIPDTTSALSGSLLPPISNRNNPFLDGHHIGKKEDMEGLTTASVFASTAAATTNPAPVTHNLESASTVTTPGLNIPGAYPGMEKERLTHGDLEMAKRATAVALERAKELALATGETMMDVVDTVLPAVKAYIPSAETTKEAAINAGQATANAGVAAGRSVGDTAANAASNIPEAPVETTKSYLASASDVIRNYVPAAVSAYLPGSTQSTTIIPSQEIGQNVHPSSSGGVGTLPGPPGEIGVALLPDERPGEKHIDELQSSPKSKAEDTPTHTGGVGTLPGDAGESDVAVLPEERNRAKLPSAQPGLGLPGDKDEAGVAVLPIERGAGGEHTSMEKDTHSVLLGKVPGLEQHDRDAVDANNSSVGNGSVAFIEPPFESTTNMYTNLPPSLSSPSPPRSNSFVSPIPVSIAASTLDGASADASTRTLAGSRKVQFEQGSNPITTTTNSVPHPQPNAVPNPTLNDGKKASIKTSVDTSTPPPALTATAAPVTLVGGVVGATTTTDGGQASTDGAGYAHGLTREDQHAHAAAERNHVDKKNREELVHHQDSTTATQGHGAPGNAVPASHSPDAASHAKSASTSSGSSTGRKPSLFSKMKGEMKVISGKIGHNEEKIEEGRRMMGKAVN